LKRAPDNLAIKKRIYRTATQSNIDLSVALLTVSVIIVFPEWLLHREILEQIAQIKNQNNLID
jgi:hypothetical protein